MTHSEKRVSCRRQNFIFVSSFFEADEEQRALNERKRRIFVLFLAGLKNERKNVLVFFIIPDVNTILHNNNNTLLMMTFQRKFHSTNLETTNHLGWKLGSLSMLLYHIKLLSVI